MSLILLDTSYTMNYSEANRIENKFNFKALLIFLTKAQYTVQQKKTKFIVPNLKSTPKKIISMLEIKYVRRYDSKLFR